MQACSALSLMGRLAWAQAYIGHHITALAISRIYAMLAKGPKLLSTATPACMSPCGCLKASYSVDAEEPAVQIDTECDFGYEWSWYHEECRPMVGFDLNTCPHVKVTPDIFVSTSLFSSCHA